ncbi:hypothetical protein Ancab_040377 [Ancistrocladus abbreviatus]
MMLSKMSLKLSPTMYALSQLLLFMFMFSMMISGMAVMHHQEERLEHNNNTIRCIERERQALLHFKQGLFDTCGILASWGSIHDEDQYLHRDCCQWRGIGCSNSTGHVISLNLRTTQFPSSGCLAGNISSSLLVLGHLNYLDLSGIDFSNSSIPNFIGSLIKLKYLNLSYSNIFGEIPPQLNNLSNLQTVDLSHNWFLHAESLAWASGLSFLKTLDLSIVELKDATDWVHVINSLPSLTHLKLNGCQLPNPSSLSQVNSSKSLSFISLRVNPLSTTSISSWLFNISSSLLELDLCDNQLKDPILEAVVNLNSLSYLDLSSNQIQNPIPKTIGNLNSLSHLDLSQNQIQSPIPETIVNLSSLSYFALSYNQLQGPLLEEIGNMKSLSYLDLSFNQFKGGIPKSFRHLCNLLVLDLSGNNVNDNLLSLLQSLSGCVERSLEELLFANSGLFGSLPDFSRFPSLLALELSNNQLNGSFPSLANNNSSLKVLLLQNNQISGSFPEDLGQLSQLVALDLSSNFFTGIVTEAHLSSLPLVEKLDLSFNKLLAFNISPNWTPPFQLEWLLLDSCRLGPHFPNWLQTQHNLQMIVLSGAGISNTLPGWFWGMFGPSSFAYANLSHNEIHGVQPNLGFQNSGVQVLDLSYNSLEGSIPLFPSQVQYLGLSNNKLSGSISSWSLTATATLIVLDLANNNLSGELPDCWMYINQLRVLNLGSNSFSGNIPNSFGNLTSLVVLDLSSNKLFGEVPLSLKYCISLQILDLSENFFSGQVPYWLGNNLVMLNALVLRQNQFFGSLPGEICHLRYIQVLDLSLNHIASTIPNCLYNSTFWSGENSYERDRWTTILVPKWFYLGKETTIVKIDIHAYLVWKGSKREYWKNLALLQSIDLSSNKLIGEIPFQISLLTGLESLNLSRNHLTGSITQKLGYLKELESLDLSRNQLSGEIPTSLSNLNFLSMLDLSYNDLSGKIPYGTQLQSFNESSYMGNPNLCGPPLHKRCVEDTTQSSHHNWEEAEDQDDEFLSLGFFISIGLGFITGFWGACGILLCKRSWRYAYFRFCNHLYDKIFEAVVVYIARPIAHFQT